MRVVLDAHEYDLDLTLRPSFVSCIYQSVGKSRWVKVAGAAKRLKLEQKGSRLIAEAEGITRRELKQIALAHSGLWHAPFEDALSKLPNSLMRPLQALASLYPGVRLPIARDDEPRVFVAIALSRRADYERFVLRWCRAIWSNFGDNPMLLLDVEDEELAKLIGSSYQVKQLKDSLNGLRKLCETIEKLFPSIKLKRGRPFETLSSVKPELMRLALLNSCKWFGPKTSDSYVLTTSGSTDVAPCDAHLALVSKRLRLASQRVEFPRAEFCRRYVCLEASAKSLGLELCPFSGKCLRAYLVKRLGELAGWFQTLAYLHGRERCKRFEPRCEGCKVRSYCINHSV
jgi:endonuclease III